MPYRGFDLRIKEHDLMLMLKRLEHDDDRRVDEEKFEYNARSFATRYISSILQETTTEKTFNDVIDGTSLSEINFPAQTFDIFISHSHSDIDLAKEIAIWAQAELGASSFIDSMSWTYAVDLLKIIDDKYSVIQIDPKLYSYDKVVLSTSHVYMMLATALLNTMRNSKYFLFLNTKNSSTKNDFGETTTFSPWLYYELEVAETIIEKPITCKYTQLLSENLAVSYKPKMNSLEEIHSLQKLKQEIEKDKLI